MLESVAATSYKSMCGGNFTKNILQALFDSTAIKRIVKDVIDSFFGFQKGYRIKGNMLSKFAFYTRQFIGN